MLYDMFDMCELQRYSIWELFVLWRWTNPDEWVMYLLRFEWLANFCRRHSMQLRWRCCPWHYSFLRLRDVIYRFWNTYNVFSLPFSFCRSLSSSFLISNSCPCRDWRYLQSEKHINNCLTEYTPFKITILPLC